MFTCSSFCNCLAMVYYFCFISDTQYKPDGDDRHDTFILEFDSLSFFFFLDTLFIFSALKLFSNKYNFPRLFFPSKEAYIESQCFLLMGSKFHILHPFQFAPGHDLIVKDQSLSPHFYHMTFLQFTIKRPCCSDSAPVNFNRRTFYNHTRLLCNLYEASSPNNSCDTKDLGLPMNVVLLTCVVLEQRTSSNAARSKVMQQDQGRA